MGGPHVVAVPYPAQSHVISLLEVAQCLASHGIRVTFVNTDFNHRRILESVCQSDTDPIPQGVDMVSIPDGIQAWEDRDDMGKLVSTISRVMPAELEALILRINGSQTDDKVTCVVADVSAGWAVGVADKMGIKGATYWPASASTLSCMLRIPIFIRDGVIDSEGKPLKDQVDLSHGMPVLNTKYLVWSCLLDDLTNRLVFHALWKHSQTGCRFAKKHICNSSLILEPAAFSLHREILPVGPLLASNRLGKSVGHFWPEESAACLAWLDRQPSNSVVYIAFGSFTVFDQAQFAELALGIELSNRPFLWVVRQGMTSDADNAFPEGFKDRTRDRGQLVGWAPQQLVLSHPSIACFLSHCGWNSTIEGVANGVPFLC